MNLSRLPCTRPLWPLLLCIASLCPVIADEKPHTKGNVTSNDVFAEVGHEQPINSLTFDMGTIDALDNKQRSEDTQKQLKMQHVLPGIKHTFILKNISQKVVTISDIQTDSISTSAEITRGGSNEGVPFPYPVKPQETVEVNVAFDPLLCYPGRTGGEVALYAPDSKEPIATLFMRGTLKGAINFLEHSADFGKVNGGKHFCDFTLIFDKRVPSQMMPTPLKLVSLNRYVSIRSLEAEKRSWV